MAASDFVMLRRTAVLALLTLLPVPLGAGGRVVAPESTAPLPHDLHIAYGDLAVEGTMIAGRVRFFQDDLELALGPMLRADAISLTPGEEANALVLRYLREHLSITVEGRRLAVEIVASGQDELDREPVWWVTIQFRAEESIEEFVVRNTLLFERFDDQRNVFKFVHFPDETPRTFFFAPGEEEHLVRF